MPVPSDDARMIYQLAQTKWLEDHPVGTKVRITKAASYGENGWCDTWTPDMTEKVGKTGIVKGAGTVGIMVEFGGITQARFYPFFVLEDYKPAPPLRPFDRVLVRMDRKSPWRPAIYSYTGSYTNGDPEYVTSIGQFPYIIPYEGNEALNGTI